MFAMSTFTILLTSGERIRLRGLAIRCEGDLLHVAGQSGPMSTLAIFPLEKILGVFQEEALSPVSLD
jgi:hypothetical protein